MGAHKKSLFLLKIAEGELSNSYKTIAGLEASNFSLNRQIVDSSNLASGEWRELLEKSGVKSVSILANGIFKNSEYEELLRVASFSGEEKKFQLLFNNGDSIEGNFIVGNYQRRGTVEDEEIYSFTLNSAAEINYRKAS